MARLLRFLLVFIAFVLFAANNGTTVGSPTYQAGKFSNSAGSFSGSNYFSLPADASNFATSAYTLKAWVKTSSTNWQAVVAIGTSGTSQAYIYIATGGLATCYLGNGSGINGANIADGTWHHITCGSSGTAGKMFVDGTYIGSFSTTATVPNLASRIGLNNSGTDPFLGEIDEVSFWETDIHGTTSFTPAASAHCGDEANLRELYHLDANANSFTGSTCGSAQGAYRRRTR